METQTGRSRDSTSKILCRGFSGPIRANCAFSVSCWIGASFTAGMPASGDSPVSYLWTSLIRPSDTSG